MGERRLSGWKAIGTTRERKTHVFIYLVPYKWPTVNDTAATHSVGLHKGGQSIPTGLLTTTAVAFGCQAADFQSQELNQFTVHPMFPCIFFLFLYFTTLLHPCTHIFIIIITISSWLNQKFKLEMFNVFLHDKKTWCTQRHMFDMYVFFCNHMYFF